MGCGNRTREDIQSDIVYYNEIMESLKQELEKFDAPTPRNGDVITFDDAGPYYINQEIDLIWKVFLQNGYAARYSDNDLRSYYEKNLVVVLYNIFEKGK